MEACSQGRARSHSIDIGISTLIRGHKHHYLHNTHDKHLTTNQLTYIYRYICIYTAYTKVIVTIRPARLCIQQGLFSRLVGT